jgi:carbonic anhydrase/SulP family sulfate permease
VRIAGNTSSHKVLGSLEYAVAVAGAKLVMVLGHTRCGAVRATVESVCLDPTKVTQQMPGVDATTCRHLPYVIDDIQKSLDKTTCPNFPKFTPEEQAAYCDDVARRNVLTTAQTILDQSQTIAQCVHEGKAMLVAAMYDVVTGRFDVLREMWGDSRDSSLRSSAGPNRSGTTIPAS